jgi:hypothetical protein
MKTEPTIPLILVVPLVLMGWALGRSLAGQISKVL